MENKIPTEPFGKLKINYHKAQAGLQKITPKELIHNSQNKIATQNLRGNFMDIRFGYGAKQNATAAEASYWLCRPTPLITVVATYKYSAKAATVGQVPSILATLLV